jgi:hypothetical protein
VVTPIAHNHVAVEKRKEGNSMRTVTRDDLLKLIAQKKRFEITQSPRLRAKINIYIEEVINKDKRYYSKLTSYNFNNEQLKYLL